MATALDLGRAGWQPYLEAARRRPMPATGPTVDPRDYERLMDRIRQAAAEVKARLGARRVILFGSFVRAAWCRPDSDVDLAVEGLPGERYWQAWRVAEEIIADRSVEVIAIETAGDSLRQAIDRYGREL